jgi:hypothetical protein
LVVLIAIFKFEHFEVLFLYQGFLFIFVVFFRLRVVIVMKWVALIDSPNLHRCVGSSFPEFSCFAASFTLFANQIDVEMSFVRRHDVMHIMQSLLARVFESVLKRPMPAFQHMTYEEAMTRYGVDKPDLRYDMRLHDLTALFRNSSASVPILSDASKFTHPDAVQHAYAHRQAVRALCLPCSLSRKEIDQLQEYAKRHAGAPKVLFADATEFFFFFFFFILFFN